MEEVKDRKPVLTEHIDRDPDHPCQMRIHGVGDRVMVTCGGVFGLTSLTLGVPIEMCDKCKGQDKERIRKMAGGILPDAVASMPTQKVNNFGLLCRKLKRLKGKTVLKGALLEAAHKGRDVEEIEIIVAELELEKD